MITALMLKGQCQKMQAGLELGLVKLEVIEQLEVVTETFLSKQYRHTLLVIPLPLPHPVQSY